MFHQHLHMCRLLWQCERHCQVLQYWGSSREWQPAQSNKVI
jgi:hypothetical protein